MSKKILNVFAFMAFMCLVLVSCSEDTADSPIVGSWELILANGNSVQTADKDYYTFNSDGSGSRDYYEGSVHRNEPFNWSEYANGNIELNYHDGVSISYTYRINGNNLELSEDRNFTYYDTYARR